MVRIDRIKEEIGWLKVLFGVSAAAYFALIGWIFSTYVDEKLEWVKVGAFMALLLVVVVVICTIFVIRKRLNELKELEKL